MIGWVALATAAVIACPVEKADYALRHTPGVTAYFRDVDSGPDWPAGVALAVHVRRTGETSWWLPWRGGSDNLQNLASTTDVTAPDWTPPNPDGGPRALGNRQYLGADAAYAIIDDIPLRGGPAPVHMLIPTADHLGRRCSSPSSSLTSSAARVAAASVAETHTSAGPHLHPSL